MPSLLHHISWADKRGGDSSCVVQPKIGCIKMSHLHDLHLPAINSGLVCTKHLLHASCCSLKTQTPSITHKSNRASKPAHTHTCRSPRPDSHDPTHSSRCHARSSMTCACCLRLRTLARGTPSTEALTRTQTSLGDPMLSSEIAGIMAFEDRLPKQKAA